MYITQNHAPPYINQMERSETLRGNLLPWDQDKKSRRCACSCIPLELRLVYRPKRISWAKFTM